MQTFNNTETCIDWQEKDQISFQLSNFLFFLAFFTPNSSTNQVSSLIFRLLLTMGCSMHIIWIVSIKQHCMFNYLASFWPIFLILNLLYSAYLTYKLSPANMPKHLVKVYNTVFAPLKLTKNEFKELIEHSSLIHLSKNEYYFIENVSSINERVSMLLEGKMLASNNGITLHHINCNEFIDSPEYKYLKTYVHHNQDCIKNKSQVHKCDHRDRKIKIESEKGLLKIRKTCVKCKDVYIQMESENNCVTKCKNNNLKNTMKKSDRMKEKCVPEKNIDCVILKENNSFSQLAQVTIIALEDCQILCWKKDLLETDTLANNSRLRSIFQNLIGKDITHKLYLLNEEQRRQQQQALTNEPILNLHPKIGPFFETNLMNKTQINNSSQLNNQYYLRNSYGRSLSVDPKNMGCCSQEFDGYIKAHHSINANPIINSSKIITKN